VTVYVDNFHAIGASQEYGRRWSYMIADSQAELDHFARLIRVGLQLSEGDRVRLDPDARHAAVLFGAVEVSYQQLAAMIALRCMGEDIGDPVTACWRRNSISRVVSSRLL
jgi:hypothetical protein